MAAEGHRMKIIDEVDFYRLLWSARVDQALATARHRREPALTDRLRVKRIAP